MKKLLKKVFKNPLTIFGLIILVGGIIFFQFYDIAFVPKGWGLISRSTSQNQGKKSNVSHELKSEIKNLTEKSFDVDLKNLSEKDLASVRAYLKFKKIKSAIIPSGVPEIYGKELNVSFSKVQGSMYKMAPFDLTYGKKKIKLNDKEMKRYINIGSQTACRYCCGAKTLVFGNGTAACGCAHSQTMRGLAAYLIKNHPEMSDDQILKELNKWRATFFPKQTIGEALSAMEKQGQPGIKEMLKEFPGFLPDMVGGC